MNLLRIDNFNDIPTNRTSAIESGLQELYLLHESTDYIYNKICYIYR
jgi:hypothetical protein